MRAYPALIDGGFLPLAAGFGASSGLIAYHDLRTGYVSLLDWLPALAGAALFFAGNLPSLFFGGFTAVLMLPATWATLKLAHKKNDESAVVGTGDYIAVAAFSFWPAMMLTATILALMFGIAGFRWKWWNRGLRGIPLAGLMGVFCLVYIVGALVL